MPFASALSEHPVPAHAVGEVAGEVLEKLGTGPDLAMLFMTPPHAGALEDGAAAVQTICQPKTLLGCAAVAVAGTGREVEETPAVSLWAGRFGDVVPARFETVRAGEGSVLAGWPGPQAVPFEPQALVLLADPYSFDIDALFAVINERYPGLPVVGGMASAARAPGANRLTSNGVILTDGAVGAFVGPGPRLTAVVSQGCRPIGTPLVVTRSEHSILRELAGEPPLERLV